jgi:hypothetical protein
MSAPAPRPLTLAEISASLPGARGAARLSPATLTRWILDGCKGRDGRRVKLAALRCGQRWLVYQTDLDAFFAALAGDLAPTPEPAPPRSKAAKVKAAAAAGRKLAAMGC